MVNFRQLLLLLALSAVGGAVCAQNQAPLTYNTLGVELVRVEGGTFTMGNNADPSAKPAHQVKVNTFYMGKYEITQGQFRQFMKASGHKSDAVRNGYSYVYRNNMHGAYKWVNTTDNVKEYNRANWRCDEYGRVAERDTMPVMHVSRRDAEAFCEWLSTETGHTYRLPTEAEWEFAARGGNKSDRHQYSGSDEIDSVAWYGHREGTAGRHPHKGGTKQPNELGLYDMSGNLSEWVADSYQSDYYQSCAKQGVADNPRCKSNSQLGVVRGGNWTNISDRCTVFDRDRYTYSNSSAGIGFRVVLEME